MFVMITRQIFDLELTVATRWTESRRVRVPGVPITYPRGRMSRARVENGECSSRYVLVSFRQ